MKRDYQTRDKREESNNDLSAANESLKSPNPNYNGKSNSRRNNDSDANHEDDDAEGESPLLFSCQCDSARTIATLLSCLRRVVTANSGSSWSTSSSIGGGNTQGGGASQRTGIGGTQSMALLGGSANKIQHATVYAGPNGLTFHVQHGLAKQSQCSVDMPKGLFREYFVGEEEVWLEDSDVEIDDDEDATQREASSQGGGGGGNREIIQGGEFGVNLTTVLECFSILSKNKSSAQSTVSTAKGPGGGASGGSGSGNKAHIGEYASLSSVPLCMSYDRGTATFHLEFLEGGSLSSAGGESSATNVGGGCLVTCEVPGVAVADDVDDGPDGDETSNQHSVNTNNNSGLASAFRSSPLLSRAILYSDALQSAVSELYDVPGASIVTVSLSKKGMELGTVGPRSEVWVDVPYHRGQGGMYVGLECYKLNAPLFGTAASSSSRDAVVRKYPLGAFLSGMRGLDIGVETCISVNSRGMMAIQHQVSRDGYYDFSEDGGGGNVKPSFVDFIMTCIEEEVDDEDIDGDAISPNNASIEMQRQHQQHNGLQDITNEDRSANVDVGSRKAREAVVKSRAGRGHAKAAPREVESSDEDKQLAPKSGKIRKQNDAVNHDGNFGGGDVDFGDDHEHEKGDEDDVTNPSLKRASNNVTNRILEELEMDQDIVSSHNRGGAGQNRKNALEDLRRRRQEQRLRQSLENQNENEMEKRDEHPKDDDKYNDGDRSSKKYSRKRRSESSKLLASRKGSRRSKEKDDDDNIDPNTSEDDQETKTTDEQSKYPNQHHLNPAQDGQSQSHSEEDDDDGDETEHEDSLDVTTDISQLFSKRSSLSTSRHGILHRSSSRERGRGGGMDDGDHDSEEEEEQEPRMMYGDTKLEFTQDGYESNGSF